MAVTRPLPALVLVGLVLTAATVTAATAGGDPTIEPGRFEEHDIRMDAGWSITYNWSADAALYFDIHSHDGPKVEYHVQNESTNGSAGTFEAPARQIYSLFWENRADETIEVRWQAEGRWIGPDEHFEDEETTPGAGGAAVAGALVGVAWAWRRHRSW